MSESLQFPARSVNYDVMKEQHGEMMPHIKALFVISYSIDNSLGQCVRRNESLTIVVLCMIYVLKIFSHVCVCQCGHMLSMCVQGTYIVCYISYTAVLRGNHGNQEWFPLQTIIHGDVVISHSHSPKYCTCTGCCTDIHIWHIWSYMYWDLYTHMCRL